jgi:murein DD-endopeptidase MepM/ murein hydrolase activator NlpD
MKPPERGSRLAIPWLGLPLCGLLAWGGAGQALWESAARRDASPGAPPVANAAPAAAAIAALPAPPGRPPDLSGQLRIGETLGSLFARRLGMAGGEAHAAAAAAARHLDPQKLRAGSDWHAYLTDDGRVERFELVVDGRGELALLRRGEAWQPFFAAFRRARRAVAVRGRVSGALEDSVADAGAPFELAYAMAEVLQWDLDFARDLQPGDEFRVLYEEVTIERSRPAVGSVLAIDYRRANGRPLEAYRFGGESDGGYYDGAGRPLQKMFLRSPLPYSRVSSRFSNRRLHPVLGVFRPHWGVDYAAPEGTPVRVTASGTVVSAGWDGGGGRTVEVRHPNDYVTAYLHLSRFADGIRAGRTVRQGDVVGFVGSTGLATAPHLDYRIRRGGRWIDPLSLPAAPAPPIATHRMAEFRASRDAMRRAFDGEPFAPPASGAERARLAAGANPTDGEAGGAPGES